MNESKMLEVYLGASELLQAAAVWLASDGRILGVNTLFAKGAHVSRRRRHNDADGGDHQEHQGGARGQGVSADKVKGVEKDLEIAGGNRHF